MLDLLKSYLPFLILALVGLTAVVLVPLARAGVLALRAYRANQKVIGAGAAAAAVAASLDALTALAATLVLSAESEVRDLKDPLKPGSWNPAVDGPRFLGRVVADLCRLGGDSLTQLRALQRLDADSTRQLLERIAEAQVAKLRATAPGTPRPMLPSPRAGEVSLDRTTAEPPEPIAPVAPAVDDPTRTLRSSGIHRATTERLVRPTKPTPDEAGHARLFVLVVIVGALAGVAMCALPIVHR